MPVQAAPEASAAEAPAEAPAEDARDAALEEAKQLLAQVAPIPCAPVTLRLPLLLPALDVQGSTCWYFSRSVTLHQSTSFYWY